MMEAQPNYIDLMVSDYLGVLIGSAVTMVGGIIAAVATTIIPWIREARQEKRLREERANYLAVHVISVLDMFITECHWIVRDRSIIEKGEDILEGVIPVKRTYSIAPKHSLPKIPEFPDHVDWKAIDSKLMYKIFKLQNFIRLANRIIKNREDGITIPLENYYYLYEYRWYGYSQVGLMAVEIMYELEEKYRVSEENEAVAGASKAEQEFSDTIKAIDKSRESNPRWEEMFKQEIMKAVMKHRKSGKPFPHQTKDEDD